MRVDVEGGRPRVFPGQRLGDGGAADLQHGRRAGGVAEELHQPRRVMAQMAHQGVGLAERLPEHQQRQVDRELHGRAGAVRPDMLDPAAQQVQHRARARDGGRLAAGQAQQLAAARRPGGAADRALDRARRRARPPLRPARSACAGAGCSSRSPACPPGPPPAGRPGRGTPPRPPHRRTGWSGSRRLPRPGRAACRPCGSPVASARARVRFHTVGAWPISASRAAMAAPIFPIPANPLRMDVPCCCGLWIVGLTILWECIVEREAGLIGLGIMGGAMSANLVSAGWTVHGYDPDASRPAGGRRGRGAGARHGRGADQRRPGDHDQPAHARRPARHRRRHRRHRGAAAPWWRPAR